MLMYDELAAWWPLLSPVEDYAEEALEVARWLRSGPNPVETVLELGSGGGHNAFHLKQWFDLTLVDLAPGMLAQSERLNPGLEHVVGDMRSVRLERRFDAVFVHDAVCYLTTIHELRALARTALAHLRPGGVLVVVPDEVRATFSQGTESGGSDEAGRGMRYLQWSWDPDPDDTWFLTHYTFVLREGDEVRVVDEQHRYGLFDVATWVAAFEAAGLEVRVAREHTEEDRTPRHVFVGIAPG